MRAASIVNATGPWLDRVRRLEDPRGAPSIRLSKGVHVLVDGGEDWDAALTIPHDKVRVSFAIPWEGMLLLGTTDTLHEGEPEDARVTDEDVRTILDEAARRRSTASAPPRASFCGLRVLPGGPGETANARRETVYTRGPTGMLSVAGGKLTTYRRIALDALDQLGVREPRPRRGRCRARSGLDAVDWPVELDARDAQRTCCTSTARSRPRCSRPARRRPSLLEPLVARPPRPARAGALRARRTSGRSPTRTCSAGARPAGSRRPTWLALGSASMAPSFTRLTQPLVRDNGELRPASWDEALDRAAAGFRRALDAGRRDRPLQLLQDHERAELRRTEVRPGRTALQQHRQL